MYVSVCMSVWAVSCIQGWPHIHYVTKDNLEFLILQKAEVIGLGHPMWCSDGISIWWCIDKPSTNLATPLAVKYLLEAAALFLEACVTV